MCLAVGLLVPVWITPAIALTLSQEQPPVVVLAPGALSTERYAAEELAHYLGRILEQEVKITNGEREEEEKDNRIPIYVGFHPKNLDLEPENLALEESLVVVREDAIHVAGGRSREKHFEHSDLPQHDRGTLYGVYELLESLGVRWFRPEPWGEHVPVQHSVTLEEGTRRAKPVYQYRYGANLYQTFAPLPGQFASPEEEQRVTEERLMARRWAVRNRQNSNLWLELEQGGFYELDFAHAYHRLLPPKRYFSTHPEYYALVNGVRSSDPNAQLCLGNPEVEEKVFEAILQTFERRPNLEIASLDPNDYALWCECDLCQKMDDPKLKAAHPGNMPDKIKGISMSNRVVEFNNRIARRLAKVKPEKRVGWYAYMMHTEVPTLVDKLEPNTAVMPVAFAGSFSDYSRGLYDTESRQNARFLEILKGYAGLARESGAPLLAHDYWSFYVWPGPLPVMHSMVDKLRHYHRDFGVVGVYNEVHPCWGPQGMILYFYTWLLRNPDGDLEKEKEIYYNGYYGPAAVPMKAYHEHLEKVAWEGNVYFGSGGSEIEALFTNELLAKTETFLKEASTLVAGNHPYERRVQGTAAGHEYAKRVRQILDLIDQVKPTDASKAIDELEKFFNSFSDGSVFDNRSSVRGSWQKIFNKYRSIVEKNAVFDSLFENPVLVQQHQRGWKFQIDPEKTGMEHGWHSTTDDSDWSPVLTTAPWQNQGFPDYHGKTWYRKAIKPPVVTPGKRLILFFGAVDGSAVVYWNGERIGEHLLDPETQAGWDQPFYFDITDIVKPDGPNQIAVSVEKHHFVGGISTPVNILEVDSIRPPE